MDLRRLEIFVAVAEERSFTRGARRSRIVQSGASAAVARLERELDVTLFDRAERRIELTEAGRVLLSKARVLLDDARSVREAMDGLRGGLQGSVTLGTVLSTGSLDLGLALADFHARHPHVNVRVRLSAGPIDGHLAAVVDGTFDAALIPLLPRTPREVAIKPVARTRLVAVCRADDPLAGVSEVALDELARRVFVDFPPEWGNRSIVDALFADAGLERDVAVEVGDITTALDLVRSGLGIAFAPAGAADHCQDLTVIQLAREPDEVRLGLAVGADRPASAATRALLAALLAHGE
ncbi:LysR family transcriptional regulator [Streptomyces sp. YIM S03343]